MLVLGTWKRTKSVGHGHNGDDLHLERRRSACTRARWERKAEVLPLGLRKQPLANLWWSTRGSSVFTMTGSRKVANSSLIRWSVFWRSSGEPISVRAWVFEEQHTVVIRDLKVLRLLGIGLVGIYMYSNLQSMHSTYYSSTMVSTMVWTEGDKVTREPQAGMMAVGKKTAFP